MGWLVAVFALVVIAALVIQVVLPYMSAAADRQIARNAARHIREHARTEPIPHDFDSERIREQREQDDPEMRGGRIEGPGGG
jgi:hypothetical protein